MATYACEPSREDKEYIWKVFNILTSKYPNSNQHVDSHSSYPNLYINGKILDQTSHTSQSTTGKKYFEWVSVERFKTLLTNILIEKTGVKL